MVCLYKCPGNHQLAGCNMNKKNEKIATKNKILFMVLYFP